ncbi:MULTISPECIES: DMT family transporter [unclassified Duganella]|uniref:DMT family transporter n=1 Tax=unclassified Duganella TaxID=2636909 RepID=UPI000890D30B|nr:MULTISPECIES: DMT family transporter [unclassified Duganella]SDG69189.1 EamA-like transporter family protein [Duganella sp. OV458]SDJ94556.1 EamA-like transporter family protein [Duganella sp. OV510]
MWYGILCGLLAGAFWGTIFVMPRWLAEFSPMELALGRYLAYGLITLLLLAPRLNGLLGRLTRDDCKVLLRHALAGNIVYYLLLSTGVQLAGVAAASLIIGLLPLSVTLLGRRDHGALPLRHLAWPLALVVAGIACINIDVFTHANGSGQPWPIVALGMLCAFGALLCWTWYAVDNARFLKRNPHYSGAEWSGLYGLSTGVVALALAVVVYACGGVGGAGRDGLARDWWHFWGVVTMVALGASVVGNQLWNIACRRVPVTLSGQLLLFEILFGLLYGFIYLRQTPRPLELAAIVLLIAGVAGSVWRHARPPAAALQAPPA